MFHIHTPAAEDHAFGFESQTLLDAGVATKLDLPASPEYALPREPIRAA